MAQPQKEIRRTLLQSTNTGPRQVINHELKMMIDAHDALEQVLSILQRQSTQLPDIADGINFYEEVERFEINLIQRALDLAAGCQKHAASLLGLNSTTLNSKIKSYQIKWKTFGTLLIWDDKEHKYKRRRKVIGT